MGNSTKTNSSTNGLDVNASMKLMESNNRAQENTTAQYKATLDTMTATLSKVMSFTEALVASSAKKDETYAQMSVAKDKMYAEERMSNVQSNNRLYAEQSSNSASILNNLVLSAGGDQTSLTNIFGMMGNAWGGGLGANLQNSFKVA